MDNRTYRYFRGEPLYKFGHGLSYTTFTYSKLKAPKKVKSGQLLRVSARVQNTGTMAGDEVAQLYVSNLDAEVPVPIRSLKGFKRIHLKPGEVRTVTFEVAADAFTVIDKNNKRTVDPGQYMITVGGRQPAKVTIDEEAGILKKLVKLI